MKTTILLLFFSALTFFSGCDCFTSCIVSPKIKLVDQLSGADLIFGTQPRYKLDSIYWKRTTDTNYFPVNFGMADTARKIIYLPYESKIYIRWNANDEDTITVNYKSDGIKSRCCPQGTFEANGIKLNNLFCRFENGEYILEK